MPADPVAARPAESPPASPGDWWSAASIRDEIIGQSIDAIVITDAELRVRIWNPAAEELYGIAAADAIGRPMAELVETLDPAGHPIDGPSARSELDQRGAWRQRILHRPLTGSRTGTEVMVDSIVTLLRGSDGQPVGALGVNRDVTTSARLESELAALGSLVLATGRARTRTEVAEAALEILCRATGAEAGLVTSTDGAYEATAHVGVNEATIDAVLSLGELTGPIAKALDAPGSVVSADVATAPLREDVRAAVRADGIEHLIVVGLRLSGRLTGVLALGWRQRAPREPSPPIIHQAAALVAAAMENARLLAAVESGFAEERLLTRRMRALVELTRLPDATTTSSAGIERLMAAIGTIVGADGSAHAVVDGERLVLTAVDRLDRTGVGRFINRPVRDIPMASRLLGGASAVMLSFDDPEMRPEARDAMARSGYRAATAFAIRDEAGLIGVIFSIFRRPIDALEIDERTLEAIGRVLDISLANHRLREGLAASERRYRDLFEASPDALLVEGPRDVIDANPAARELFGADLVGRPVTDLIVADREIVDREALGPEGISGLTGTGRRLDGSTFPEEVDLRPIEMVGERRMLAIVRDLTERTRMQAELIQAQKMDAIGMLVAGVAHELNNPLAAIVGFSHLLRTDPGLPADLRGQADLLVQEANRTRVIVQNLLDFARLRPPERVEMDLRPLLDGVLGLQSYVLAQNHLSVEVDLPPDLPPVSVDRSQMQQVLINLTVNASQAIHGLGRPGTIRIVARADRGAEGPIVRIEIADDGPGVPPEILDRLFMPFVTTKEPGEGTGLGLSVSFGIVKSHGGTLRHRPNPGGGATFVIELPVGRGATAAPPPGATGLATMPQALGHASRSTGPAGVDEAHGPTLSDGSAPARHLRILVLDDEPSIRDLLGRLLTRGGHEPILVDTGPAALEIVRRDPPDAILCDHRMAGMSGTEFLGEVMAIDPGLAGRFAFMSGDVLNPELRAFAEARHVPLMAKPFDIPAVAAVVASLVGPERS